MHHLYYASYLYVQGKISVNEYGNVELFKASMLPAGTVHVRGKQPVK